MKNRMNNSQSLHIYPSINYLENNLVRRECILERKTSDRIENQEILWFEFPVIENIEKLQDDAEAFTIACILIAMAEKRDLVVHGTVSWLLLSNLEQFCSVWISWMPWRYHPIQIVCDRIINSLDFEEKTHTPPKEDTAILAFSGGLDSTFSLWRHTLAPASYSTRKIIACMFVHGFDIPLCDTTIYDSAFQKAQSTVSSLGIPLIPVRTNLKEASNLEWDDFHMTAVVACLQNLKTLSHAALVASTKPYVALRLPYGTNPLTDPLLSSQSMRIIHDGCSHTRDQKSLAISSWELGLRNLRVCWEGQQKDRNCCVCDKCLISMCSFLANGIPIPESFSKPMDRSGLQLIRAHMSITPSSVWPQILADARRNHVQDRWVSILALKIRFNRLEYRFRKIYTPARIWFQRILKRQHNLPESPLVNI